jgi:uncharacterized protein YutE (UPF0331/DUF86 family)
MPNIDDIIINKSQSIQRCIDRARQEYLAASDFKNDFSRQDSSTINILRACEQAIDLANYIVKKLKLGIPKQTREIFDLLYQNKIIDEKLSINLKKMVSFRNISVHEYMDIDSNILENVINKELDNLKEFYEVINSFNNKHD